MTNKAKYQEYNIEVVEDFVNSIKPFHTKLLSSMESNTHGESTNIEIEDITRNNVITLKYEDHSTRTWEGDIVLSGGPMLEGIGTSVDYSLFTTQQADLEYDYNGQVFIQPAQEGFGEEGRGRCCCWTCCKFRLELLQLIEFVREDCPCAGTSACEPTGAVRKRQAALLRESPHEINVVCVFLVCLGFRIL